MDIPSLKWHRISPGWSRSEIQSPTGTTTISIERQTKFKIYHCRIDYPDGSHWSEDRESLELAKLAGEWRLNKDVGSKLGWRKTDHTEMIQRVTIYPGSEANVEPVVVALQGLGLAEPEIRVLRFRKGDAIDRILAYKDDSIGGLENRLDFASSSALFEAIWIRVGYVRIELDEFRNSGETINSPSLFEWENDRKSDA